jgi:ABC-type Fe3+ transport system substrate-binding protein
MKINFTKKQYEDLVKLVYLGTWMINAHRTDDLVEKYEDLEQYLLSFYKDFDMEKYIEFDKKLNKFFPTGEFEEDTDVEQYIDEYNNDIFLGRINRQISQA